MFYVDGGLVDTISGYNGDISIGTLCQAGSANFDGTLKSMTLGQRPIPIQRGARGNDNK